MVRIVQISDTHLGRDEARFAGNWPPLAAWIAAEAPDLVIHSGDLSGDGAGVDDDFAYCAELTEALPAPLLAVPGNHDVGDPFSTRQPPTAERLSRWNARFGTDRWSRDVEDWRLIGFDSMILSSGLPEEEAQFAWLEAEMHGADGRRIAWFCHQPLFIRGWEEGDTGYWTVRTGPRARLKALADAYGLALVGSGHVHLSHEMRLGGTRFVWCPSSAFTVGPGMQPPLGGEKWLGAVRYDFAGREVRTERVRLPQLRQHWIDDVAAAETGAPSQGSQPARDVHAPTQVGKPDG
ncbi:metallophosphoesterase [Amaricoccus sp.]|uniref:metallophosphoesterase family protein n=1 Tax=Amaricoccus sp. TaxID=1872485 RepID=UPI002616EC89|nr:metallophosphoesterase [Amaricoccus sp.]HRO10595.1 metallophosphoesterase [Amaricoccus sp.]